MFSKFIIPYFIPPFATQKGGYLHRITIIKKEKIFVIHS